MSIRIIYFDSNEMAEKGDLFLRRQSEVFEDSEADFKGLFKVRQKKGVFELIPSAEYPLFLEDKLITGPIEVNNGTAFASKEVNYKVFAEHEKVPLSSKTVWFSRITAALVFFILFSEVALVSWLPQKFEEAEAFSREYALEKCNSTIDRIRRELVDGSDDTPLAESAKEFVIGEVDRVAAYVRENQSLLNEKQLGQLLISLQGYSKISEKLKTGTVWQKLPELEVEKWIESHISEKVLNINK